MAVSNQMATSLGIHFLFFLCAFELHELVVCVQEESMSPEIYTDSEESGSQSEEATDDDESYGDDEHGDATQESDADDDLENVSNESCSESGDSGDEYFCDAKACLYTFLHEHLHIFVHSDDSAVHF